MKTLLSILFGAIIGYVGAYHYYHTTGKISITETKTITNIVSITETQIVEQLAYQYIVKTNEVWKTNVIEKIVQTQKYVPPVQKPVAQQAVQQQAAPVSSPATTVKPSTGLRGPTSAGSVRQPSNDGKGKIRVGAKRNMDGSIK